MITTEALFEAEVGWARVPCIAGHPMVHDGKKTASAARSCSVAFPSLRCSLLAGCGYVAINLLLNSAITLKMLL